jgi:hypothetical protein
MHRPQPGPLSGKTGFVVLHLLRDPNVSWKASTVSCSMIGSCRQRWRPSAAMVDGVGCAGSCVAEREKWAASVQLNVDHWNGRKLN